MLNSWSRVYCGETLTLFEYTMGLSANSPRREFCNRDEIDLHNRMSTIDLYLFFSGHGGGAIRRDCECDGN